MSPQVNTYDPEIWLESTTRALKEYVGNAFSAAYEVVMEFPSTDDVMKYVPLEKTLIHFELDTQGHRPLGFGTNWVNMNFTGSPGSTTVAPQEAAIHTLNFDVGVWTSDRAGGTTSRMRAMQKLSNLFVGSYAQENLDAAVNDGDGRIEIISYEGGRFVTDRINDVDVYRMVDTTLVVRVYSRTPAGAAAPAIESVIADGNLDIGGVPVE